MIDRRRLVVWTIVVVVSAGLAIPAIAVVGRFGDVADGNPFLADIEWLADSGVTRGCAPDSFCPDRAVTRQQMAAFLHRLAVAGVVDAATATEADRAAMADDAVKLAGRGAPTYDTFVVGDATASGDQSTYATISTTGSQLAQVVFETVVDGTEGVFDASVSVQSISTVGPVLVSIWLEVGEATCSDYLYAEPAAFRNASVPALERDEIGLTASLVFTTAGTHTVSLCGQSYDGDSGVVSAALTGVISASPNNVHTLTTIAP